MAQSWLGRMVSEWGFCGGEEVSGDLCKMTEVLPHLGALQCSLDTGRWVGGPTKGDLCKWGLM